MIKKVTTLGGLADLFTLEFTLSAIVAIFILGGVWVSITAGITVAQATANESAARVEKVEDTVNKIEMDLAIVKVNQSTFGMKADELTDEVKEQRKDIKKILSILGGRYTHDNSE
jgi:hypothetical protein